MGLNTEIISYIYIYIYIYIYKENQRDGWKLEQTDRTSYNLQYFIVSNSSEAKEVV